MRVGIVGAGIAGALLARRLHDAGATVTLHGGATLARRGSAARRSGRAPHPGAGGDATAASGGLVRGFEVDAAASRDAAESLAEIRGCATLREQTGYREIGSVYLLAPFAELPDRLAAIDRRLPGSAALLDAAELGRAYPFRDLPAGTVGVAERNAGYLSPARWRSSILDHPGLVLAAVPVRAVRPDPAVLLADGALARYDAVVVAAGAWTPGLLHRSGLDTQGLRVRRIQYGIHRAAWPGLGAFVDDTSGLYGRATPDGSYLLGLPTGRVLDPGDDPAAPPADAALADRVAACAQHRLGGAIAPPHRLVCATDCYHDQPGLALRGRAGLFTFTAGSGGRPRPSSSRAGARPTHPRRRRLTGGAAAGVAIRPAAARPCWPARLRSARSPCTSWSPRPVHHRRRRPAPTGPWSG